MNISLFFIYTNINMYNILKTPERMTKLTSTHKPIHYYIYNILPYYIYSAILLLASCNNHTATNNDNGDGDTIAFKYAEHITPIHRAVVSTSPHCRLLFDLGAAETIKGVCDLQYITQSDIQRRAAKGIIADCGNSMSPTIERIITLSPDAIFMSPYEGGSYAQLENIGAAIIECADYMETSALGRAEWMRFYGMLTGKENTADSLFAAIEHNYKTIVSENNKQKKHPKVLTERVTNGVWYCPGGNSSMAKLIKDAGGKYVFADNNQSGSLNLSPETVISKSTDADVWLFIYYGNRPLTRNELTAEYSGYKTIKAFKDGNIYECNGKTSTYFEEISFRPDFLLEELTHILYSSDSTLRYYKRISE